MPDYSSLYQSAGSTFNVDPLLAQAVGQVESSGDPNAVSRDAQGNPIAHGLMQVTAPNLQRLNVPDPYNPEFNIPAGTRMLDEALTATNGNVPMALRIYQGGPDQSKWGPQNAAYPAKVAAAYQKLKSTQVPANGPTAPTPSTAQDDIDAFLTGKSAAAPSTAPPTGAAPGALDDVDAFLAGKAVPSAPPPDPTTIDPVTGYPVDAQDQSKPIPGAGTTLAGAGQGTLIPGNSVAIPKTADEARALLGGAAPGYVSMAPLPFQLRETTPGSGVADPNSGLAGMKADWLAPIRGPGNALIDLMQGPTTGTVTPAGTALLAGAAASGGLTPSIARGTGAAIADTAAYGKPLAQLYDRPGSNPLMSGRPGAPPARGNPPVATLPPTNPLAADVMQPPGSLPANALTAPRTTAQIQREDGVGYNQAVLTQKAEQAAASTPQSLGAAASRDLAPPGTIPPETPEQKLTNLGKSVTQSAEDRAGPQQEDHTVYVPGVERPLAARVFNPQNSLDDKTLRATDPVYRAQQEGIERSNNQTMVDLLGKDAGDDNALKVAHDDRDEVAPPAQQLFEGEKPVDATPLVKQIDSLLAGPDGKRGAVQRTLSDVRSSLFDADGNLETLPSQLYGARKNITDLLKKGVGAGADDVRASKSILTALLDQIDPIINDGAPKYQTYLDQFHEASQPINQMEFLQKYQTGPKKLTGVDGYLQLNKVQKMLDDIYQGQKAKGINPAKSLTDDQIQNIVNVRNELAAQSLKDRLAKVKGSDTTQQTNRAGVLGDGPLGTAVKGAAEMGAHALLFHTTGGIGNAAMAIHRAVIKPAREASKAVRQENALVARKNALLSTQPNPLSSD
jgi:hypothetical protein